MREKERRMNLYISENAFIALTLSAIETYVYREATGVLLGYKKGDDAYYVEAVVPFQWVKRTKDSAKIAPQRRKRVYDVLTDYMKYEIIGEFHTHPRGEAKLSKNDKEYIRENNYKIELV